MKKEGSPNTEVLFGKQLINPCRSHDPSVFLHGLSMSTAEQRVDKQTNRQWQTSQ